LLLTSAIFLTVGAVIVVALLALTGDKPAPKPLSSNYSVSNIGLDQLKVSDLQVGQNNRLTINGELKINKGLVLAPGSLPANPQTGQIYLNSDDHKIYYYNGTTFIDLATSDSLSLISGTGIAVTGQTIRNTGVISVTGTPGQINVSSANGDITLSLVAQPASSGVALGASHTSGSLAMFDSNSAVTDSILSQSGTAVTLGGSLNVSGATSAASFSGNGANLTSLNATNITTGTLSDARLSANVALLNANQTFTGNNIFSGTFLHQNASNSVTAFQIQNAGAQTLLVANTTSQQVAIGPAAVPANGVLTVGTNTTVATGGLYLGTDTSLYRSAANTLNLGVDDSLKVTNVAGDSIGLQSDTTSTYLDGRTTGTDNWVLAARVSGDSAARFSIKANGQTQWGDGTSQDVTLSRAFTGVLRLEGIGTNGAGARLFFGDGNNTTNQNAWIGEYGATDSDILQLHGKSGVGYLLPEHRQTSLRSPVPASCSCRPLAQLVACCWAVTPICTARPPTACKQTTVS